MFIWMLILSVYNWMTVREQSKGGSLTPPTKEKQNTQDGKQRETWRCTRGPTTWREDTATWPQTKGSRDPHVKTPNLARGRVATPKGMPLSSNAGTTTGGARSGRQPRRQGRTPPEMNHSATTEPCSQTQAPSGDLAPRNQGAGSPGSKEPGTRDPETDPTPHSNLKEEPVDLLYITMDSTDPFAKLLQECNDWDAAWLHEQDSEGHYEEHETTPPAREAGLGVCTDQPQVPTSTKDAAKRSSRWSAPTTTATAVDQEEQQHIVMRLLNVTSELASSLRNLAGRKQRRAKKNRESRKARLINRKTKRVRDLRAALHACPFCGEQCHTIANCPLLPAGTYDPHREKRKVARGKTQMVLDLTSPAAYSQWNPDQGVDKCPSRVGRYDTGGLRS